MLRQSILDLAFLAGFENKLIPLVTKEEEIWFEKGRKFQKLEFSDNPTEDEQKLIEEVEALSTRLFR